MDTLKQALEQLAPTQSSNQEKTLELKKDFRDVVLEPEEEQEALRLAREAKHYKQKRIDYLQTLNEPKKYPHYSANEIFQMIKAEIDIDADNHEIIGNLSAYFAGEKLQNVEGLNLEKGICLFGGVGVGKTTLMKMLSRNQKQSYIMKMCRAVEDEFSQDGDVVLKRYGIAKEATRNSDPFGHQILGYCFDDLGTEPLSKYYGKDTNVMAEIILNRYDNNLPFNQTHITTNLSVDQIAARYGTRVTDRMRQMFNLVSFDKEAKSRRK